MALEAAMRKAMTAMTAMTAVTVATGAMGVKQAILSNLSLLGRKNAAALRVAKFQRDVFVCIQMHSIALSV